MCLAKVQWYIVVAVGGMGIGLRVNISVNNIFLFIAKLLINTCMLERILNKKFHIGWVFGFLFASMGICIYALSQLV